MRLWGKNIKISVEEDYKEKNGLNENANTKEVYSSAEVMLEIIREEYKNEIDRGRSFDSRAGIFLPIIGAVIIFLPELVKGIKFKSKVGNIYAMFPYISIIILIIGALYFLISSLNYFIKVLQSKDYKTIDYNDFTQENSEYSKSIFSLALVEKYRDILDINIPVNNEKAELYKNGIIMIRNSIFIIAIIIINSIFIQIL